MIRLLGFIVGSAASIGAILLILGIPEFHLSNPHLDKTRFDEALQNLKEKQRELELAAQMPDAGPDGSEAASTPMPAAVASASAGIPEAKPALPQPDQAADELTVAALPIAPLEERHWHSFWNPFRSEIAARGFISQLERVTGLDYRVVKVRSGVYEVAFAYDSDIERQAKLSQIQAATGLDLPGS